MVYNNYTRLSKLQSKPSVSAVLVENNDRDGAKVHFKIDAKLHLTLWLN